VAKAKQHQATASSAEALPTHLDQARREVSNLGDSQSQWEAQAREQQQAAKGLVDGLHDLGERVRHAEAAHDEAMAAAAAAIAEREALEERLREAELRVDQARAESKARERQAAQERQRIHQLVEETGRLHARESGSHATDDRESLFENILEASVQLASAEKGVYLQPTEPFDILATERFDEAQSTSVLLDAVARQVAERQEPLVLNTALEIRAVADDPLAASLRNLVGYPIVTGERLTGVAVVANRRDGEFTDEDTRLLLGIGSHAAVALENRRLRRDAEVSYAATIALLCNVIEAKDPYTHGHCEEVAALALATARELGFGPEDQHVIFQAGLLHDVGKIAVSDGILLKPGDLLPAEREVIETHASVGADMVDQVPALQNLTGVIRHHHERHDGTGYPDKLAGDDIPLLARILGVADAYEAMCSDRPYRPALEPEAARAELRRVAGTQFDAEIVTALLRVLDQPEALERAREAITVATGRDGA